ncbi:MAG: hypothetical protein AB7I36_18275 [Rhodospirillaceae bacterium]
MAQRITHTLADDIAVVQEALETVKSPLARATLTSALETLNALMRDDALDVRLAAYPLAPDERRHSAGHPMPDKSVDWF